MSAAEIANALAGRRSGAGWVAQCPGHNDRKPSLSIRDSNGKTLVHCWAGCAQTDVLDALRARGLWPEQPQPERAPMSPADRRAWAARRRRAERMAGDAEAWRAAVVDELEIVKRHAFDAGRWLELAAVAPELEHWKQLRGAALAEAFVKVRTERPDETAALIAGRRRDEQAARNVCGWVLRKIGANYDAKSSKAA